MRFAVFLSAFLALQAHAETPPESQCTGSEVVIFHCEIGDKNLSVCLLEDERVSYRFGRLGEPEITIDSVANQSGRAYPGGGETRLRFSKDGHDYLVFDVIRYSGSDEETGMRTFEDRAGVHVVKDGKLVASLSCTGGGVDFGKVNTSALKSKRKEDFVDLD